MDENITYGILWRTTYTRNPDAWLVFFCGYSNYQDAYNQAVKLRDHPDCLAVKIVEKVETFEDVSGTLWEREKDG